MDLAFVFPGQGAQYVGMGKTFYDAHDSVKRLFEEASDTVGKDFVHLCFEGPESVLVQTDNVQPALTLVNLSCCEVLRQEGFVPAAVAGHSVSEYAALCAAGVFTFADTMRLVQVRGAAMKEAAERNPGGMTAILGLQADALTAISDEVKDTGSVELANYNSPTQIVITGHKAAVDKAAALAKAGGAKLVVPLKVSGPWHSRLMAGAQEPIRLALETVTVSPPSIPVVANLTASFHPPDPADIRRALVDQIVSPVLWAQSVKTLIDAGHRTFVEVGPGRVLTGLLKDISREAKGLNVQDADSLARFKAAVAARSA